MIFSVLGRQAEQFLKAGCVSYVVAQQTVKIGREAVDAADALINGEKLANQNIIVPLVPVTKGNVAKIDINAIREPVGWHPWLADFLRARRRSVGRGLQLGLGGQVLGAVRVSHVDGYAIAA